MEKNNNIVNIYKLYNSENNKSYLYSIKNTTKPASFSYFILTSVNKTPQVQKLQNAIKFFQMNNLNIRKIDKDDKDYEEFITLFASLISNTQPTTKDTIHDSLRHSSLRFIPQKKK